jgi:dTDP-4-dehydrorhamnose reductase
MKKRKIIITGCNGFLGSHLVLFFVKNGYEVYGMDIADHTHHENIVYHRVDAAQASDVLNIFQSVKPQMIINTIGLADVDACEEAPVMAHRINVQTAESVARSCAVIGTRLIHISTDHLFLGNNALYTEDALPQPVNVYGETKLEAEKISLRENKNTVAIRTNFYGWNRFGKKVTSAEWIYQKLLCREPITLFTNYYFTPIEVSYFIEALHEVSMSAFTGIIHIAGSQRCSKYEFGQCMAREFGFDVSSLREGLLNAGSLRVTRPNDMSLSTEKFRTLFRSKLSDLREGMQRFRDTTIKRLP